MPRLITDVESRWDFSNRRRRSFEGTREHGFVGGCDSTGRWMDIAGTPVADEIAG
jgi:hypothetical protein